MENWGLITYRETALLYDGNFSSNSNQERVATIIAHELAHMVPPGLSPALGTLDPTTTFPVLRGRGLVPL